MVSAPARRCLGALAVCRPPRTGRRGDATTREICVCERGPSAARGSAAGRGFHRDAPGAVRRPDLIVRRRPRDGRRPSHRARSAVGAPPRSVPLPRSATPPRTSPERSRDGDAIVVVHQTEGSAPRRTSRPGRTPRDRTSALHRTDGLVDTKAPSDRAAVRGRRRVRRGPVASSFTLRGATARSCWRAGALGTTPRTGPTASPASGAAPSAATIEEPSTCGVLAAPERPIAGPANIRCRMDSPSRTNVVGSACRRK